MKAPFRDGHSLKGIFFPSCTEDADPGDRHPEFFRKEWLLKKKTGVGTSAIYFAKKNMKSVCAVIRGKW